MNESALVRRVIVRCEWILRIELWSRPRERSAVDNGQAAQMGWAHHWIVHAHIDRRYLRTHRRLRHGKDAAVHRRSNCCLTDIVVCASGSIEVRPAERCVAELIAWEIPCTVRVVG